MRPQLHSPPMSARRPIYCCLSAVAAGFLLLGCGSGTDSTSADIDPLVAADLNGQLDRIETFFNAGNCDRAAKAVENLKLAADSVTGKTGEQFTSDMNEIADNLEEKVNQECQEAEPTTTTTTETTDTAPTTTDTEPTTTETTTTETTTKDTTTTTPNPPTPPGGGNTGGNGNNGGGPTGPGGGVTPGKRGGNR